MDDFKTQLPVSEGSAFSLSLHSRTSCTLHTECSHATDWSLTSVKELKWLKLAFTATSSINAPFLRHLRPIMYWMKWNDATFSFLSLLSEVIASHCAAILKDLQGAVCLSCKTSPFMFSQLTQKKAPPEAHTRPTVTQRPNPSSWKRTLWKASRLFLLQKKTQRRISSSNLSIFHWAALRTYAEPPSLLTYCEQISRQLSARTEEEHDGILAAALPTWSPPDLWNVALRCWTPRAHILSKANRVFNL